MTTRRDSSQPPGDGTHSPSRRRRRWDPLRTFISPPEFRRHSQAALWSTIFRSRTTSCSLALIDGGGPEAARSLRLTTRRVYWTERDDDARDRPSKQTATRHRSRTQQLVVRVADYADLPEVIG